MNIVAKENLFNLMLKLDLNKLLENKINNAAFFNVEV